MNANTVVPARPEPGVQEAVTPTVFVAGAPEPALSVRALTAAAPLDERTAVVCANDPSRWLGREATVALPVHLVDGTTRWLVLARGTLGAAVVDVAAGRDDRELRLVSEPLPSEVGEVGEDDSPSVLGRQWLRDGGRWIEQVTTRPAHRGRPIALPTTIVVSRQQDAPHIAAELWIARGDAREIESTFPLIPAWDTALEGQPDAAYDRALSADFPTFANVYRRWALNEDGFFAGDTFDPAAFFDDATVEPTPLPFRDALTLDDGGGRRRPSVEVSTDGGASWATYPGTAEPVRDRAAVYLEDATLPAGFLAAGKAGAARVRVTASLRSPRSVELRRWRGNPFRGIGASGERVLDLGDTMKFRRVAPGSVNHDAVREGALAADEADDALALHAALIERIEQPPTRKGRFRGRARWVLAGVHPGLRIGDRVALDVGQGVVTRITHRFDRATTTLEMDL